MRLFTIILLVASGVLAQAQQNKSKLVVGIIVDQMRQDYLLRYGSRFGENGFKRFYNEGFVFQNVHYNYIPTKTACGHASVYSGTTPYMHGIIGNDWYSREEGREIYCAEDHNYQTVGSQTDNGEMSPKNIKTTTITDELRLIYQFKSKVLSLSIKDRGAIMPAGSSGTAIWMDKEAGNFISSTYYMQQLPDWVTKFNNRKLADKYLRSTWNTKFDIGSYTASGPDLEPSETNIDGQMNGFPYDLSTLDKDYENIIKTPFGNEYLTELVLSALDNESLGEDDITDFLAISFSATDYIGHDNGPYSVEVEDTYLRLDEELSRIFNRLDEKVGKGNYTVFLTADHAVATIPQFLLDRKMNSGYFDKDAVMKQLKEALNEEFGTAPWIEEEINNNIYLNHKYFEETDVSIDEVKKFIQRFLLTFNGVSEAYTDDEVKAFSHCDDGLKGLLSRGFNSRRSGDLVFVLDPSWLIAWDTDATGHGSGYTYDTHVPLLWYGAGIKQGKSFQRHEITQIAPTLSMLLGISLPSGAMDDPIYELLED
ncbi:alkaline phosphatase PafA [Fulvivirga lutea]|uniref:Alkaline phosphatase family protein n=1 Tax=Fulvivirga lutea TaxID=2810512 RepID=A0A974WHV2_9BACT|nr:alkaline phosphatase PafA [Fulvivirga lutea]QSE98833.1 alkaline phosphatase family protein [Fulvivirga lutea]